MVRAELDRLGDRLRVELTAADLTLLDTYRRGFRESYEGVVGTIRDGLGLEVSGRPAKSTNAIVEKLRRSSMRLTQMQDIAGCRIVVSNVAEQDRLAGEIGRLFQSSVMDRRRKPSHGYRAIHIVVRLHVLPVEVQVRTSLQHLWAELSEKSADMFGISLKYGGGPPEVRLKLDEYSALIAELEEHQQSVIGEAERIGTVMKHIREAIEKLSATPKDTR
jgi:putative GTP pyrophosphokinase